MTWVAFRLVVLGTLSAFSLLISSPAVGSTVKLLHSEVEAFEMRLELIDSAQSTIHLSSYEISDDNTSGRIFVALLNAAQRGGESHDAACVTYQ